MKHLFQNMKQTLHVVKYDSAMAPPRRLKGDVKLDDPGALKALAHPARLAVVDELYQGTERTSSELAELTGLSPSAMSYHLRALERWGIVEHGAEREDGRERPWRAAGRTLSLDPETISAGAADVVAPRPCSTYATCSAAGPRWSRARRSHGATSPG